MKKTAEQIEAEVKERWKKLQTVQPPFEKVERAVNWMWKELGYSEPEIELYDSPIAISNITKEPGYWSLWWNSWAGWYEASKQQGGKIVDNYEEFHNWNEAIIFCVPTPEKAYISKRFVECHWKGDIVSNDKGMAVKFADGWGLWQIDGIRLDEQIVMRPETQTIQQIHNERNADVQTIRVERFGWERYLRESNAELLDSRTNDLEGTKEALYSSPLGKRLVATCVTAKLVQMGVPENINSCEEAQRWLQGDKPFNVITRT